MVRPVTFYCDVTMKMHTFGTTNYLQLRGPTGLGYRFYKPYAVWCIYMFAK